MKKALLILVAMVVATTAFAVDASKMTDAGTKALLFQASGFGASNFGGSYAIGAKYYLSPGLALRPVLTFGYRTETTERDPDTITYAPYHRTFNDEKDKAMTFGLQLAVEKVLFTSGAVNVNAGAVAQFGMGSTTHEEGYTEVNSATTTTRTYSEKTEGSTTNFGGGVLLGSEWFITENISLGAEYQFGLTSTSEGKDEGTGTYTVTVGSTSTTTTTTVKNPLTSSMGFGFQTVGLVLGIRF